MLVCQISNAVALDVMWPQIILHVTYPAVGHRHPLRGNNIHNQMTVIFSHFTKHSQDLSVVPDFEARQTESSSSVICVTQVFVCVVGVTLGAWRAAALLLSPCHYHIGCRKLLAVEMFVGEDGANPRWVVEAVWKKDFLFSPFSNGRGVFRWGWMKLTEMPRLPGGGGLEGLHGDGCSTK